MLRDIVDVAAEVGVTPRQLRHWIAIGLIWPYQPAAGRGRPARLDSEDIAWIAALAEAVRAGIDVTAIAANRRHIPEMAGRVVVAAARLAEHAPAWLDADPAVAV